MAGFTTETPAFCGIEVLFGRDNVRGNDSSYCDKPCDRTKLLVYEKEGFGRLFGV